MEHYSSGYDTGHQGFTSGFWGVGGGIIYLGYHWFWGRSATLSVSASSLLISSRRVGINRITHFDYAYAIGSPRLRSMIPV